ncbi:hypothetical protein ERJ75_000053900 [Trypanosoma vivax]|uniref:Eukaryotic translation initiation factor 3 subunit 10 n=1 Tax=Trypanosoma vivax (strain Y486) TaxID=1055687 RepID=G0U7B7_TRYVY|nr:hypothetical protein TRVL_02401 [Trypanosoma vivax]KAH8620730.1 hypothetical protein ERJ75_000053900 [Trypanosoma vivax]CCC51775.1 conserved hypothetical protein [Trypanosoma vivax Y486]
MNSEDKVRGHLEKAKELKKDGHYKEAIAALQQLSSMKVQWGPIYKEALDYLADLCFNHVDGSKLDQLFPAFRWNRKKVHGTQYLEEGTRYIVESVLKHLRMKCEALHNSARQLKEGVPSPEDRILAALSGQGLSQRAKEQFLDTAENLVGRVSNEMLGFSTIGHSAKLLPIYLDAAEDLINLCEKWKMRRAIGRVSDALSRFFERFLFPSFQGHRYDHEIAKQQSKELEADREHFLKKDITAPKAISVLCKLLEALTTMKSWHSSWVTLECLTKMMQELDTNNTPLGASKLRAYNVMASVFWKCSHYAFNAYCLRLALRVASGEEQASLASQAVIATLCVRDVNKERNIYARDYDFQVKNNTRIARLFSLSSAPDGRTLWQHLQERGFYNKASADVRALDQLMRSDIVDSETVQKIVRQLSVVMKDKNLSKYEAALRNVIMQRQVECMASRVANVKFAALHPWEDSPSMETYVKVIEPFLLNESGIVVEIDHKTSSIAFGSMAKAKVLDAFDALASKVDPQKPAVLKELKMSTERLEAIRNRARALNELQCYLEEKSEDREKTLKDEEEKKRKESREECIRREEEKKAALQKAIADRKIAEHNKQVNIERRKALIRRLQEKYESFKVNVPCDRLGVSEFTQEVTAQLVRYLKRTLQEKSSDVTNANHFERACREIELPRRKALQLEEAEKQKAQRAKARDNFLIEHRKEFDKRQQDNQLLKKFLKEAAEYEQHMQNRGKTSKREEQQMLLQKEKERLQRL